MKFTLKDFQEKATREALAKIRKARSIYDASGVPVSFSLSAATGSGKTVIAAAVVEALFNGNDEYGFDADPKAVVLWVTDDPSLNEQTRYRFMQASEDITFMRLRTIDDGFDQETFDTNVVYFLNRQKLAKSSNLVKVRDGRNFTLWQTIQNSIASDDIHLYMMLDEAHRGLGVQKTKDVNERQTIYSQLIDGREGERPMPVVIGISATIDRFDFAMQGRRERTSLQSVVVDSRDVQESGLLKDTIKLLIPNESGSFDTALLSEACKSLNQATERWANYRRREGLDNPVVPAMVVQVPNKVENDVLYQLCEQISNEVAGIDRARSFVNVFGEHSDLSLGGTKYIVQYVEPQRVQEMTEVRVIFAKEAISTGWDCPRAEVLYSMRPGKDKTIITQIIGRMVRTPLARRIESDQLLNSVACYLPRFDRDTTAKVAAKLLGSDGDDDDTISQNPGRRVLTTPVTVNWDESLDEGVREAFQALPSVVTPRSTASQTDRLFQVTGRLALNGISEEVDSEELEWLCDFLDWERKKYKGDYNGALNGVITATLRELTASRVDKTVDEQSMRIDADMPLVEDAYHDAQRMLGHEATREYTAHVLMTEAVRDSLRTKAIVGALSRVPQIKDDLQKECEDRADGLISHYRDEISSLSEEAQSSFDDLKAKSTKPQLSQMIVPDAREVDSCVEQDGKSLPLPTYQKHVLSNGDDHTVPALLNEAERYVLAAELARKSLVAWYRNPSGAGKYSLQIPWFDGEIYRSMQPDFVFFSRNNDGTIVPSIVDPHGSFLSDSIPKLRGYVKYVRDFGDRFRRIETVDKVDGAYLYLDLKDPGIQIQISEGEYDTAAEIYREYGKTYE